MTDREQRKDRFRDRLSEYIDGHLGVEEEVLIERHLERCEDCARTLAELEAVVDQAASSTTRRDGMRSKNWAPAMSWSQTRWAGLTLRQAATLSTPAS